jgi:hypothetical protein
MGTCEGNEEAMGAWQEDMHAVLVLEVCAGANAAKKRVVGILSVLVVVVMVSLVVTVSLLGKNVF